MILMLDYPETLRGQLELACTTLEEKVEDKKIYNKLPTDEQMAMIKSIQELKHIITNETEKFLDD
ncbi:hypothetical protein LCGC14_0194910 [marine sediment metagenome]|uniref:Uncharacterized protein n=1 Tax=marine sediment metagenome TaxID=412755 RepID=A0A0F9UPT8_9ZZZZ